MVYRSCDVELSGCQRPIEVVPFSREVNLVVYRYYRHGTSISRHIYDSV